MAKTQKNLRINQLTERQLNELQSRLTLSHTETITLAVDRLYHSELSDTEGLRHAISYLRQRISELEARGFATWPQWMAEDMEAVERVIAEFSFSN